MKKTSQKSGLPTSKKLDDLGRAIRNNQTQAVRILLKNFTDINFQLAMRDVTLSPDIIQLGVLSYALLKGANSEIIELLVKKGAYIGAPFTLNGITSTPIQYALDNDLEQYVPILLASANLMVELPTGELIHTLEYLWQNREKLAEAKFLSYTNSLINKIDLSQDYPWLILYIYNNKIDFMRFLFENGINPFQKFDFKSPTGLALIHTLFLTVCVYGSLEMLQEFLRHPAANINQDHAAELGEGDGIAQFTGLMALIINEDHQDPQKKPEKIKKIAYLLQHGADVFSSTDVKFIKTKNVKRHDVSFGGPARVVKKRKAKILTPAVLAVEAEDPDVINLIFNAIKEAHVDEEIKWSALDQALLNLMYYENSPNVELLSLFALHGYKFKRPLIDPLQDNYWSSPLSLFVMAWSNNSYIPFNFAEALIAYGADINAHNEKYPFTNPLYAAFAVDSLPILEYFLTKNPDASLLKQFPLYIRSKECFSALLNYIKEKQFYQDEQLMAYLLRNVRQVEYFKMLLDAFPELFTVNSGLYFGILSLVQYQNKVDFFQCYLETSGQPANIEEYVPLQTALTLYDEVPDLLKAILDYLGKKEFKEQLKSGMSLLATAIMTQDAQMTRLILKISQNPAEMIANTTINEIPVLVFTAKEKRYRDVYNLLSSFKGVMEAKITFNFREDYVGKLVANEVVLKRKFDLSYMHPEELQLHITETFKNIVKSVRKLSCPENANLKQQENALFQLACFFETLCIYQQENIKGVKFMLAEKLATSIRNHLMHHYMLLDISDINALLAITQELIVKVKANPDVLDNDYWMSLNKPFITWNVQLNKKSHDLPDNNLTNPLAISHSIVQLEEYQQEVKPSSIFDRELVNACALHLKILGERYQQTPHYKWGKARKELKLCHGLRTKLGHDHEMAALLYSDIVPWAIFSVVDKILNIKDKILNVTHQSVSRKFGI